MPHATLSEAFLHAAEKIGGGRQQWNKVAGPTAALLLTLKRANWKWSSPSKLIDDVGRAWCTVSDPPVAIAQAMKNTVRRRRLKLIAASHPGLIPDNPDVGKSRGRHDDVIIDFANVLNPLITGKRNTLRDTPEFKRKHAAALLSACGGGQWTQTRKAAVTKWGISDNKCQLCFEEPGTLLHRRSCRHNTPEGGWSQLPDKAKLAADAISQQRMDILKTTGLLTLRLPTIPNRAHDTLHWGQPPPQMIPPGTRWFIDGSQLFPRRRQLSTFGFGVAAVNKNGDLIAWGWGVPPNWCDSASAAEAWALCTVLRTAQEIPYVVTDCYGLLCTAARGASYSTSVEQHRTPT